MGFKLDKATMKKIKRVRKAEKARKRLTSGEPLTEQQKQSLKHVIARGLTICSTKAEITLRKRIAPLGFKQNQVLFGYIPDFIHEYFRIAVEADGGVHSREDVKRRDTRKNEVFSEHNWILLRFSNHVIQEYTDTVVEKIKETMRLRERGVL